MLGDGRGQPIGDRPDFATPSRVFPLAEPHRVRDWPAGRAEPLGSPLPPHTRRPRDVIRFTGRALARRPGQLALRRQRTFGAAALVDAVVRRSRGHAPGGGRQRLAQSSRGDGRGQALGSSRDPLLGQRRCRHVVGLAGAQQGQAPTMRTSAGTMTSAAPWALARRTSASRSTAPSVVSRTSRSPLRASGRETTSKGVLGNASPASASTAASDTISPPTLAKRLARPLMVMKPWASMATISPVSYQPSGGASSTPGLSGR